MCVGCEYVKSEYAAVFTLQQCRDSRHAHKNVGRRFVDQMAQSCQAPEVFTPNKFAVIRNMSSAVALLIYSPKNIRKSTLVNDIPL